MAKRFNSKQGRSGDKFQFDFFGLVSVIVLIVSFILIYFTILRYIEKGWGGIWQMFKEVFIHLGFCLLVALGFVLLVAFIITVQALFSKWRKIKVFISYQHTHQEIASMIFEKLNNKWIDVRFIPFTPAHHDSMILLIETEIRNSDVLLVLPGAHKSFVDAEILTARTLGKILIFLKMSDDQTTPDTALTGYPIFELKKLEAFNFDPLIRFIYYTNNLWKDTFRNFLRISYGAGDYLISFFYFYVILNGVVEIVTRITAAFNLDLAVLIGIYYMQGLTLIFCVIFAFSYLAETVQRLKAIKIARQKIITGNCTFEYLRKGLRYLKGDLQILKTMHRGVLPLRY